MELSVTQDALLELRHIQDICWRDSENIDYLELYQNDMERCLKRLNLTKRAGSEPFVWLKSLEASRMLERLVHELLPRTTRSLNQNDRDILQAMCELRATSSEFAVPAAKILHAALCGYHDREWKKLKDGGYVYTDGPGSSGYYLTRLGNHIVSELKLED